MYECGCLGALFGEHRQVPGWVVNVQHARATPVVPDQPPSPAFPLGTDDQGRDLAAVLVAGLPMTLHIGFIAGGVGLTIGILLGLLSGYRRRALDVVIRILVGSDGPCRRNRPPLTESMLP